MTHMISTKNQPFLKNMKIPSNLNDIKPRSTYLRNYYYIGFDTMEGGTRLSVFTSYFKVKNVEGENWRASTILVHVRCWWLTWYQRKINLFWKIWKSLLTSMILNQDPLIYGTIIILGLIQWKVEQGYLYLQVISRWKMWKVKTGEQAPFWCTLGVDDSHDINEKSTFSEKYENPF